MKLQDLQSPYRELAEMRREKLKDTEFVKQWSDNFEEYGTLANAYDWTETPEGDEFWDLINQGKLPEIPASSLAELAEWQKSKEPIQESVIRVMIKKSNSLLYWYAKQIGCIFSVESRDNDYYCLLGDNERLIYKGDCEILTEQPASEQPTLIGGKTDTEWLFHFAGQAMQGYLSMRSTSDKTPLAGEVAEEAIEYATVLLTKLKEVV